MAASERMVIRPAWLLDVVSGELLAGRAVVVDGDRIAQVTGADDGPAEGAVVVDLPDQTLLPGLIEDIRLLEHPGFVMKDGAVVRHDRPATP